MENIDQLLELLGGRRVLNHVCKTITKDQIHLPHSDFRYFFQSNPKRTKLLEA
jgi:class I fructose-bisphosphate aldolase